MLILRVLSADGRRVEREIRLAGTEVTIGRSDDNDVILDDDSVSRHHARLQFGARGYVIVDEGSANGLWLRGQRVPSATLALDDFFHVGDCLLQLIDDAAARGVSTPAPPAKGWGCWAAVFLFVAAGSCGGGGLMLYLLRDHWVPFFVHGGGSSPSTDETPGSTATPPPAEETPCPPPSAHLCPWTHGTPTASECPPGFCWDGGPLGSASCKQQALAEHSHRTRWSDVFCDDGFTPVLSRCSDVIERCVAGP